MLLAKLNYNTATRAYEMCYWYWSQPLLGCRGPQPKHASNPASGSLTPVLFIVALFEGFPEFATNEFFITGESYAGN